jgi:uncharacterized damage-inducible protein DinB
VSAPLEQTGFPEGTADELELYLRWLAFLRGAILRKALGLTDEQARWHPDGKLLPLLGVVNHLTGVETRWIDGEMFGVATTKADDEYEPGAGTTIEAAIAAYRRRAEATDGAVREIADLSTPTCSADGTDLRFVLIHLINETARHAGHADATRELLDGTTGE